MLCLLPIYFVIQLFHAYRKLCAHILCCLSKIACIMSFWTYPLTLLVVCSVSSCTVTLAKHKHVNRKYNLNHTYIEPCYMWQVICIIPSTVIFICRACVYSISRLDSEAQTPEGNFWAFWEARNYMIECQP